MANNDALRNLARWGRVVCAASTLLLVGYCLYLAATPAELELLLRQATPGVVTNPSRPVLTAAALVAALPALLFIYGLWLAWDLFGLAAKGGLYSATGQKTLTRLGWLAIVGAICGIAVRTAVPLILTNGNPTGQRTLILGVDSGQILSLIAGVLFFIFARVLSEAAALDQENKSFV